MTVTRIGTANLYDRSIQNITRQQAELASQMEHASAGKRVIRASDDPVAAAQAERARTRMTRIDTDQRVLDAQTATITYGEATLGEMYDAIEDFRSLLVQAGNGTFNQTQRDTLVEQLQSLRDQVLAYSNRTDSNGLPLFRGLDAKSNIPFPNGTSAINAGQVNNTDYSITNTLNGALAFFSGVTGNGVLTVELGAEDPATPGSYLPNQGKAWASVGTIVDANAATSLQDNLAVEFFYDANDTLSYRIRNTDTNALLPLNDKEGNPITPAVTELAYKDGESIFVSGMQFAITGVPYADKDNPGTTGDVFTITQSKPQSVFDVLDQAIASVRDAGNTDGTTSYGALAHGLAKAQAEIDTQLNRINTVRGYAGNLLSQAERMGNTLDARSEQMENQRTTAEDIDMVAALSQLKTQETAVSAALQSYASIQKLSLMDYIR